MSQRAAQVARRAALERRRAERGAREPQDAASVHVAVERVDGDFAAAAARADDRDLVIERHQLFVEQRHLAERAPRARDVFRLRNTRWPLPS